MDRQYRFGECPEVFVFIYRGMSQSILYPEDVRDQGPGHRDNVYIVFDPEVVTGSCNYVMLVIPLVGLWALSYLFPPASWFEITSPTLSCVFVLVITLGWYEVFMLKLSAWRTRRNARLKERKSSKAIEMQKLRITATKRCRNCLTPYRDQNPGGGKFMYSYYGHISKRPILDLSVPPGLGLSNSGILRDLVGKGGKILNGKHASIDAERRAMIDKRCENRGNCQESRGEKAKRKAEEKRLARLEKKLAEEKERKQREEVARLVEERMKSRNEKMEAKVMVIEGLESIKTHNAEVIHGYKGGSSSSHNHGNVGTRYLDRMQGTFLSSSKAFTGGGFFGKNNATNIPREQKSNTTIDTIYNSSRRELSQSDHITGKLNPSRDDKSMNRSVSLLSSSISKCSTSSCLLFGTSGVLNPK
ncbi:hypothetical protein BC332_02435 [Capsicum chinense]|nr:hypothetical protein BC332_02435 [Capsicum chinense]